MAKSLASILSQIERLQKEAASIQSEVIARIRKDIVKFGLTAEQLFASTGGVKQGNTKLGTKINKGAKPPKYADSAGNTWGGMGKRPEWIRQAIAAGKALEDFLITKATAPTGSKARLSKSVAKKTNAVRVLRRLPKPDQATINFLHAKAWLPMAQRAIGRRRAC
jgi:DNA-binding protein H-NS